MLPFHGFGFGNGMILFITLDTANGSGYCGCGFQNSFVYISLADAGSSFYMLCYLRLASSSTGGAGRYCVYFLLLLYYGHGRNGYN